MLAKAVSLAQQAYRHALEEFSVPHCRDDGMRRKRYRQTCCANVGETDAPRFTHGVVVGAAASPGCCGRWDLDVQHRRPCLAALDLSLFTRIAPALSRKSIRVHGHASRTLVHSALHRCVGNGRWSLPCGRSHRTGQRRSFMTVEGRSVFGLGIV